MSSLSRLKTLRRSLHRRRHQLHPHHRSHTLSPQHIFSHNLEIGALARAGRLEAARHLFDKMPTRDVVSWNAILTAHWQSGDLDESKRLFNTMPERNTVSWNSMIAGCLENGKPDEASHYFVRMPVRNIASWNAMISGMVKCGRFDDAEKLFDEMTERNVVTYTAMVDGLAKKGEIERARELFGRMPKRNVVSWAVMISGFVENGRFEEAREFFNRMPEKNVVAVTAMITGCCKEGKMEDARSLFDGIRDKDLVIWNAMIAGYAHSGRGEEALALQIEMLESGMKPDHATLIAVLTACSALALLQRGRQTHMVAIKTRLDSNISLSNALITMYSKCGSIGDSELIFQHIEHRDLVSWNTLIAACAQHGHYEKALLLFRNMDTSGLAPNGITCLSVLSACRHAGKVEESLEWFDSMSSLYGVPPRAEHYACLVDVLSQAGRLEKAFEYIREMPFVTEEAVWGALLRGCRMYSNVELGEIAAENLLLLDSQNSGAYVMLSNIYAAAGMWADVTRVRSLMKEQGVKKQPGYSWTEILDEVHLFVVGDVSHPQIGNIRFELGRIGLHMEMASVEGDVVLESLYECWLPHA